MTTRYAVRYAGPDTTITETPDGEWTRWEMARAAAIIHIEEHLAACRETLAVLKRAGNYAEHYWLMAEGGMSIGGEAEVVRDGLTD